MKIFTKEQIETGINLIGAQGLTHMDPKSIGPFHDSEAFRSLVLLTMLAARALPPSSCIAALGQLMFECGYLLAQSELKEVKQIQDELIDKLDPEKES